MEWHNAKLLPVGLPSLAYQVTPPEVADYMRIIAMPKKKKRCLANVRCHIDGNKLVEPAIMIINVNAVINDVIGRSDVVTTAIWLRFLRTFLHEVGHVVNLLDNRDPGDHNRYERDIDYRYEVERQADAWAEEAMARIARDPLLGQPRAGYLGNYPGLYILRMARNAFGFGRGEGGSGTAYNEALAVARAAKVGGQFTLADVARMLKVDRGKVKKLAQALGIGRVYLDGAGRKHLFFVWSDIQKIITAAKNSY